jgi:hypothetical protein
LEGREKILRGSSEYEDLTSVSWRRARLRPDLAGGM